MGEVASDSNAKPSEGETPVENRKSSSVTSSAAATKKLLAARKKSFKNLKSKDSMKKIEGAKYCLQDELFLQEPEVLPLIIGFLGRAKAADLILEILNVFEVLLTGVPDNLSSTAVDGQEGTEPKIEIHPDANVSRVIVSEARYILEQSNAPNSTWKDGEPFRAVWLMNGLPSEIKLLGVESDDVEFAALSCLATLFQHLSDHTFLENAGTQEVTSRFLKFGSHSERRFHQPMLAIVDSFSLSVPGRSFLRNNGASEVLKAMLVKITNPTGSLSPEDLAIVGANAATISKCFCRIEFAKELLQTSKSIDSFVKEDTAYPVIDAMVSLLQKDVASAFSPPAAVVATPAAPGQTASAAAANPAALSSATVTPFQSHKCVAIITSLGRMVQLSDKCKVRAKEQGILPVLLDCFRVPQDDNLHQVADKLLHLSVELPGSGAKKLAIDPRVFSAIREEVHPSENNETADVAASVIEKSPFLAPENVATMLETLCSAEDKRVLFRFVRWLATVVESPANAFVLGESSIGGFLKILIETAPEHLLLVGFLSKCVKAIVSESSRACEVCGTETRDPTVALITFLHPQSLKTEESADEVAFQYTSNLAGNEYQLCKLEWLDEDEAEAIFEPVSLTLVRHNVDPFLYAVEALDALVLGYSKWNTQPSDPSIAAGATDFHELLIQKLESSNAAGSSTVGVVGGKAGVAAPSKKKIDISKPPVVGEAIACSILEKAVGLLKFIPVYSDRLPGVSNGILKLLTKLMKLPGGIKAMLHLARLAGNSGSSGAETDKTGDPTAAPPVNQFHEWPLAADMTRHTEFEHLVYPFLHVLGSKNATFLEIEAAIEALEVFTSPEFGSTVVVYTHSTSVGATSVEIPISQTDVCVNVVTSSGVLVLLILYTDGCRLGDYPADLTHRRAFADKVESLVLRLVTFGGKLEETALLKYRAQQEGSSEQSQPQPTQPSEQTDSNKPKSPPDFLYVTRWAKAILDLAFDVPRFEYSSYSAILLAAELCNTKIALALLSAGASPDTASVDGTTALMMALITGNEELVQELLRRNADVDKMTFDGQDLCAWNCALTAPLGRNVSQTITNSYESNCDVHNMSLLTQLGTICGSPTLLNQFLAAQVDVNVSNADGNFLLHALVSKLLVRKQVRGLDLCLWYSSQQVDKQFLLANVTALLEKHSADVNACNLLGQSALHLALLFGHTDAVKCLLRHGANPNIQDVYGYLPLHYACLGFCTSNEENGKSIGAIEVIQELLDAASKFELAAGKHVDLRKHKLPHEKIAIVIEHILDEGYLDTTVPKAVTAKVANQVQILSTRGFRDGLLPWHFACGGCSQVVSTLCLDDDMRSRFCGNDSVRAAILVYLKEKFAVDLSLKANKEMTSLHFALKADVNGFNTNVIDVLLVTEACRAQINDVHEATLVDLLPPIPEGSQVDVLTANLRAIHCYVSSRSFDSKYHVILPNGHHLEDLYREQIQPSDRISSMATSGGLKPKYLYLMESAFSPLHCAVQSSDALSLRLLSFDDISIAPEGGDLPLLALACVARCSAQVVEKLINQQANMRVHLPLLGAQRDVIVNQIANCNLASRKHASALHYAVLYEDVEVVKALVLREEHTNVNVRRSGDGFTPLHLACEMSHMELIKLLLDHGANLLLMSTLSSSANGVTPLHLLLKNDTNDNEKLRALIADKYLRAEMLLKDLGASLAHRPVTPGTPRVSNENDLAGVEPCVDPNTIVQNHSDQEITCMLLAAEEFNLELHARVSQLRENQREDQALGKRLMKDLGKSDDVLQLFFKLFSEVPSASVRVPTQSNSSSGSSQSASPPQSPPSARIVTFETLSHRHECYRQKIVRSQWIAPRPPAVTRHAPNSTVDPNASSNSEPSGDTSSPDAGAID